MNAKMPELKRAFEAAMQAVLGRSFYTIVRPVSALQSLLQTDPHTVSALSPQAKCVVSFLREPPADTGPVFMKLIEKTFGRDITMRTWESVKKCAAAQSVATLRQSPHEH